jgi:hypothetical protein
MSLPFYPENRINPEAAGCGGFSSGQAFGCTKGLANAKPGFAQNDNPLVRVFL